MSHEEAVEVDEWETEDGLRLHARLVQLEELDRLHELRLAQLEEEVARLKTRRLRDAKK